MKYLLFVVMLFPAVSNASAIEKLKAFVSATHSFRAHFEQSVANGKLGAAQHASGEMMFSRPGKFRWIYQKPYEQLIVGDSKKLWVYDADLNQVTSRNLDQAIGSSPAALLAGQNEIEKMYDLAEGKTENGIEWLEATPKSKESSFQGVRMGFSHNELAVMELRDYFGQVTLIRFSQLEKNPHLSADLFKFTPPKGADVIGE